MCEITGIADLDWEDDTVDGGSSLAELNGCKHKVAVLRQDAELASSIYKPEPHGYTLQNRSISSAGVSPMRIGGSAEGRISASWGDKDGVKYEAGTKVEVHDENGNYAKVEVEQNSSGQGNAEVVVGHKEE
jgi:hypothetical protein